jgi:histidine triad (HIT) family protein
MDCIFCKIASKEIKGETIYEDGHAFAILDIMPRTTGHTMVIPKVHAPTILDLPDEEIGPVFEAVKKVTARLKEILNPDGFTIGINHGDVSGQTVKHLHIHVMPRWNGDKGASIHSVVNNPGSEELSALSARLRF